MSTYDWLKVCEEVIWIIAVVFVIPMLNKWVNNNVKDSKRAFMRDTVEDLCNSYQQTELSGTAKNEGVVADAVKAMQAHGYSVDAATLNAIKHYIETCVVNIHKNEAVINSVAKTKTENDIQGTAQSVENAEEEKVTVPDDVQ